MDAFIQGFTEVMKAIGTYGVPAVWTGISILGAVAVGIGLYRGIVAFAGWAQKHVDRWIEKKEIRDERQTAALETLAETSQKQHVTQERQTEILLLMDRDCKERHEATHRRLDEQGTALTRILRHLFQEEGKEAQ